VPLDTCSLYTGLVVLQRRSEDAGGKWVARGLLSFFGLLVGWGGDPNWPPLSKRANPPPRPPGGAVSGSDTANGDAVEDQILLVCPLDSGLSFEFFNRLAFFPGFDTDSETCLARFLCISIPSGSSSTLDARCVGGQRDAGRKRTVSKGGLCMEEELVQPSTCLD